MSTLEWFRLEVGWHNNHVQSRGSVDMHTDDLKPKETSQPFCASCWLVYFGSCRKLLKIWRIIQYCFNASIAAASGSQLLVCSRKSCLTRSCVCLNVSYRLTYPLYVYTTYRKFSRLSLWISEQCFIFNWSLSRSNLKRWFNGNIRFSMDYTFHRRKAWCVFSYHKCLHTNDYPKENKQCCMFTVF